MRTRLVLLGLVAAAAAALPASPAQAYCDPVTSAVVGHCTNPCYLVGGVVKRVVPEVETNCLA
jgi:hypothetical protein